MSKHREFICICDKKFNGAGFWVADKKHVIEKSSYDKAIQALKFIYINSDCESSVRIAENILKAQTDLLTKQALGEK